MTTAVASDPREQLAVLEKQLDALSSRRASLTERADRARRDRAATLREVAEAVASGSGDTKVLQEHARRESDEVDAVEQGLSLLEIKERELVEQISECRRVVAREQADEALQGYRACLVDLDEKTRSFALDVVAPILQKIAVAYRSAVVANANAAAAGAEVTEVERRWGAYQLHGLQDVIEQVRKYAGDATEMQRTASWAREAAARTSTSAFSAAG